jgi:hypothetical protein
MAGSLLCLAQSSRPDARVKPKPAAQSAVSLTQREAKRYAHDLEASVWFSRPPL